MLEKILNIRILPVRRRRIYHFSLICICILPSLVLATAPTPRLVNGKKRRNTVYNWQISTDGGNTYSNLLNGVNYTVVLTNQLQLHDIPSSFAGYRFRCVTDGNAGVPYKISFTNHWTGTQNNLWSNPANWSCGALPDAFTDVYITTDAVLVNVDATVYSLTVAPPATVTVQTGINFTVLH